LNRLGLEAAFKLRILDLNAALKVEKYQNIMLNYKKKKQLKNNNNRL